ncbi:hypothetical protein A5634_19820 [Mycobacterium asiaticum]|uniref:Uncharacterized protein n=1 Tax=Mycobacterium asiaticum TaxID=1790 RepID=A0A1A3P3Y5_MYCAS|nr:hypothetical protein [Mycobacterium asiaticum]OBK28886.1 hypothetical protein A5634_19820 [Mycobacterium asiaticum]
MTTTLGDAPGTRPPTVDDVVRELHELKKREGITAPKVRSGGAMLQRLRISEDEHERRRSQGVDLAMATVEALKCVVHSYRRSSVTGSGIADQRWVILNHELNLDGAFMLNLGERQKLLYAPAVEPGEDVPRLGEKQYYSRAQAVIGSFAVHVLTLQKSLCWAPGEWEAKEAARIARLPEPARVSAIFDALMIAAALHQDPAASSRTVGVALPELLAAVQEFPAKQRNDATHLFFAAISAVGSALYNTAAREYMKTDDRLVLPWELFKHLVFTSQWLTDGDYAFVAKRCQSELHSDVSNWPQWLPYDLQKLLDGRNEVFFDSDEGRTTQLFMRAFEESLHLLALLTQRVDSLRLWDVADTNGNFVVITLVHDEKRPGIEALLTPPADDENPDAKTRTVDLQGDNAGTPHHPTTSDPSAAPDPKQDPSAKEDGNR